MTAERILSRTEIEFDDREPPIQLPARRRRDRIAGAITSPVRRPWHWWSGLEPAERLMYRGLGLLAGGLALVWPPLALIVPGAVLTMTALGFTLAQQERADG